MPRLKMPSGQQTIYDELVDSAGGAKMLQLRQIAQYWGRGDRAAKKWAEEKALPKYELNGIPCYAARDVAAAIYNSEI